MVGIRGLYGGAGRFEIALPDQTSKGIASGEELGARRIGVIGSMFLLCVTLIDRNSRIRRRDLV